MNEGKWLIWSHEHRGWWPQSRSGYVKSIQHAGRFTFDEALEIVNQGNYGMRGDVPEETMMPAEHPVIQRVEEMT